ncbi:hypothetical protein XhyaCFBP1156_12730 [Xanthomonas hyacinthi]|uniref:Uncharacterized protein n=1 Tax=Xanthomonas hyacinthi TaxID=56455 RepID=A0A2S7EUV1_9XANT|nr:hypothetical protein XhyaCFBP1156_12730 [Xanthomonas hyacinthi]
MARTMQATFQAVAWHRRTPTRSVGPGRAVAASANPKGQSGCLGQGTGGNIWFNRIFPLALCFWPFVCKEFCGKAMVAWAHARGVQLRLI